MSANKNCFTAILLSIINAVVEDLSHGDTKMSELLLFFEEEHEKKNVTTLQESFDPFRHFLSMCEVLIRFLIEMVIIQTLVNELIKDVTICKYHSKL